MDWKNYENYDEVSRQQQITIDLRTAIENVDKRALDAQVAVGSFIKQTTDRIDAIWLKLNSLEKQIAEEPVIEKSWLDKLFRR